MGNSLLAVRDIDHKYIVVDTDYQKCENGRIRNTEFLDRNAGAVLMLESEGFSGVIIRRMRPFICDSQKGELLLT